MKKNINWKTVRRLVKEMFSRDHGGIPAARKLQFYGNDAVCSFKYFVTNDDPQQVFVLVCLILMGVCFLLIMVSYLSILINALKVSKPLLKNGPKAQKKDIKKRNLQLQKNIAAIIITDMICMVPLIIVCFLHMGKVIDATVWYSVFALIVLPINSAINPILTNAKIKIMRNFIFKNFRRVFNLKIPCITNRSVGEVNIEMGPMGGTPAGQNGEEIEPAAAS